MNDWGVIAVVAIALVAWIGIKRLSWISSGRARSCLKQGALVVDVRSPAEFRARHLSGALNLPLDKLLELAPRQLPDRQRVILLHCLSGTRSGIARRELKSLGYKSVFNLGSFGRAKGIVQNEQN